MSLVGKVGFVTGAARGLGKLFSEDLLQRGAKVIIVDIREEEGKQTESEFQQKYGNGNAKFYSCDITKYDDVDILYKKVLDENGQIDILINNAGVGGGGMERHKVFEINLFSLINLTEKALHSMQDNKHKQGSFRGIIFNIASNAGLYTSNTEFLDIYHSSKHAVVGYSVSKDLHLCQSADMSIRVYTICPAFVKTDLTKPFQEIPEMGKIIEAHGGWTDADRVTRVVMKLLESNPADVKSGGLFSVSQDQCVHVARDMFKEIRTPYEI